MAVVVHLLNWVTVHVFFLCFVVWLWITEIVCSSYKSYSDLSKECCSMATGIALSS